MLYAVVGQFIFIIIFMKTNKLTTKFKTEHCHKYEETIYEAYGKDSILKCFISDSFGEKVIDEFAVYSNIEEELSIVDSSSLNLVYIRAIISKNNIERILKGKFNNLVIYADKPVEAAIFAYILLENKKPDYFISLDATIIPQEYIKRFDEYVKDKEKGELLCRYLSTFKKDCSALITASDVTKDMLSLLYTNEVRCIVIVPTSSRTVALGIPSLRVKDIETQIYEEDNDKFKKLFLMLIDEFDIRVDKFIYAYLLNNINSTDTLRTIKEICHRTDNLYSLEEKYGTSILRNAVNCGDFCFTGCIAQGGAAYRNSVNDCLDIIRYLVSIGLRYSKFKINDISSMANDLHDSYKLGLIYKTIMEAGYSTTDEDIRTFIANFISMAQCNDHLTPIDDSHTPSYYQRLDSIRCEQMETMLPYIPKSVFSMRDADGKTLLIIAAEKLTELPNLFKLILNYSPDVNVIDEDGCTALHYIGDLERWNALITAGADCSIKDNDGRIPAKGFDKEELQNLLVKKEFSNTDRIYAERMIFSIIDDCYSSEIVYENEHIIIALFEIIRPTARRSWDNYTPLMAIIVQEGFFPKLYDKMLNRGIDINAVTDTGNNALRIAVLSPECTAAKIRYLIEHGIDEKPHKYMGSIATIAAGLFHIKSMEWDALWNLSDKSLFTYHDVEAESPIMVALRYQNIEAIRFLFNHDAIPTDELELITERINRIKSEIIRTECMDLFSAHKARIH